MGFTGIYWVLLGFTRFYRVLLGLTGFNWVLIGLKNKRKQMEQVERTRPGTGAFQRRRRRRRRRRPTAATGRPPSSAAAGRRFPSTAPSADTAPETESNFTISREVVAPFFNVSTSGFSVVMETTRKMAPPSSQCGRGRKPLGWSGTFWPRFYFWKGNFWFGRRTGR